jgi:CRISPR/Cas system-associated protein Csx1
MPNVQHVSVRPYIYSPQQKDETEKQIKEMFEANGNSKKSETICFSCAASSEKGWELEVLCGL